MLPRCEAEVKTITLTVTEREAQWIDAGLVYVNAEYGAWLDSGPPVRDKAITARGGVLALLARLRALASWPSNTP